MKAVDDPSVPFDDYYTTPEFSWIRLEVPAWKWRESLGPTAPPPVPPKGGKDPKKPPNGGKKTPP